MTRSIVFCLLVFIASGCTLVMPVQPIRVEGTAMLPALKDGDRIVISKNPDKLERGDIVVFYFPLDQRKSYIKRIVGLPGETLEIREGAVLVNGTILEEPYVDSKFNQSRRSLPEIRVPQKSYFVLGDNRDNSSDSRIWGTVEGKLIYGRYVMKYSEAK